MQKQTIFKRKVTSLMTKTQPKSLLGHFQELSQKHQFLHLVKQL